METTGRLQGCSNEYQNTIAVSMEIRRYQLAQGRLSLKSFLRLRLRNSVIAFCQRKFANLPPHLFCSITNVCPNRFSVVEEN